MLTFRALFHRARQVTNLPLRPIESVAARVWQIAPPEESQRVKAFFLPGQFERIIRFSQFSGTPAEERGSVEGTARVVHAATRGFLLRDAMVSHGTVYCGGAAEFLAEHQRRFPVSRVETEQAQGAIYSTFGGNKYFGQWLIDDLVTYHLAREAGTPVRTQRALSPHARAYEEHLGIDALPISVARFKELVMFVDVGQNRNKAARFDRNRQRLLGRYPTPSHPGVFLVRGGSGERRILGEEMAIAEHLQRTRGFRIVDVMGSDLPTLLQASAGADVVAGIEGSHLVHAVLVMGAGKSLFVMQPPNRYCSLLKDLTDRDGQHYGFVVGKLKGDAFHVEIDEVERTLDLLPPPGRTG
jgi:hypothetical protein